MRTLALVALCGAASSAAAQGWEMGMMSGISHASLSSGQEFQWTPTATAGAFFKRPLTRWFAVQPEIAHVRRSGISRVEGTTLTVTADYAEVPVMLQMQLAPANRITPYVMAGPNLMVRLRCSQVFVGGGLRVRGDCERVSASVSDRFDFGIAGGAGLRADLRVLTFVLEGRASASLRPDILDVDAGGSRGAGFAMLAGLSFPLSRGRAVRPVMLPPLAPLPMAPMVVPQRTPTPFEPAALPVVQSAARIRVTMRLDDVEAREAIEAIAALTGYNVVATASATKRVSLVLFSIPAEEAVQAIAEVAGLTVLRPASLGQATIVSRRP